MTEFPFSLNNPFKMICGVFSLLFLGQRDNCKIEERVKSVQDMKQARLY